MSIDGRLPPNADPSTAEDDRSLRARVRRQLPLQDAGLLLVREHLGRAVPQIETDAEARVAVEEIVGQLGGRLGFSARREAAEDVDVWTSPAGAALVVRPAGAGNVVEQLRWLSRARDRLLVQRGLPARKLTALCIVCGALVNWRQIEEAALMRRTIDHVRVISLDALLSLAEVRAEGGLAHTDVLTLLRPASVCADAVVELVTRGVRRGSDRGHTGVGPGTEPRRAEVRRQATGSPSRGLPGSNQGQNDF